MHLWGPIPKAVVCYILEPWKLHYHKSLKGYWAGAPHWSTVSWGNAGPQFLLSAPLMTSFIKDSIFSCLCSFSLFRFLSDNCPPCATHRDMQMYTKTQTQTQSSLHRAPVPHRPSSQPVVNCTHLRTLTGGCSMSPSNLLRGTPFNILRGRVPCPFP